MYTPYNRDNEVFRLRIVFTPTLHPEPWEVPDLGDITENLKLPDILWRPMPGNSWPSSQGAYGWSGYWQRSLGETFCGLVAESPLKKDTTYSHQKRTEGG